MAALEGKHSIEAKIDKRGEARTKKKKKKKKRKRISVALVKPKARLSRSWMSSPLLSGRRSGSMG